MVGRQRNPRKVRDPQERFWEKVDKEGPVPTYRPDLGPCWLWRAFVSHLGYGRFSADVRGRWRQVQAHRWIYEQLVGAIPQGYYVDHLCRVRGCVNPAHLEAVTERENVRRGQSFAGRRAGQTHCIHGHLLDEANTYVRADRGTRECRACLGERVSLHALRREVSRLRDENAALRAELAAAHQANGT